MKVSDIIKARDKAYKELRDSFVDRLARRIPVNCIWNKNALIGVSRKRICLCKEVAGSKDFICDQNAIAETCKFFESVKTDEARVTRIFDKWLENGGDKWVELRANYWLLDKIVAGLQSSWIVRLLCRLGVL